MTRARRVVLIAVASGASTALVGGLLFQGDKVSSANASDKVQAMATSLQTGQSSSAVPAAGRTVSEFSKDARAERTEWSAYMTSELDRILTSYPTEPENTQLMTLEPMNLLKKARERAVVDAAAVGVGSVEKAVAELGRNIQLTTGLATSDVTEQRAEWSTTYQRPDIKMANAESVSDIITSAMVVARR